MLYFLFTIVLIYDAVFLHMNVLLSGKISLDIFITKKSLEISFGCIYSKKIFGEVLHVKKDAN